MSAIPIPLFSHSRKKANRRVFSILTCCLSSWYVNFELFSANLHEYDVHLQKPLYADMESERRNNSSSASLYRRPMSRKPRDWYQNRPCRIYLRIQFQIDATSGRLIFSRFHFDSSPAQTLPALTYWLAKAHKGEATDLPFLHIFTQTEFVRAHLFFRYWSGKS